MTRNKTTRRGATLVKQLLTLARKTEIKTEIVYVNTIVEAISRLIKGTFPKNIDISLELTPGPLTILADASQITQVLLNLCLNARDAMPDGGAVKLNTYSVDGSERRSRYMMSRLRNAMRALMSLTLVWEWTKTFKAKSLSPSSLPKRSAKARGSALRSRTAL